MNKKEIDVSYASMRQAWQEKKFYYFALFIWACRSRNAIYKRLWVVLILTGQWFSKPVLVITQTLTCNNVLSFQVPRVFINGKCIGGGDETQALEQSGKLSGLLQ